MYLRVWYGAGWGGAGDVEKTIAPFDCGKNGVKNEQVCLESLSLSFSAAFSKLNKWAFLSSSASEMNECRIYVMRAIKQKHTHTHTFSDNKINLNYDNLRV